MRQDPLHPVVPFLNDDESTRFMPDCQTETTNPPGDDPLERWESDGGLSR